MPFEGTYCDGLRESLADSGAEAKIKVAAAALRECPKSVELILVSTLEGLAVEAARIEHPAKNDESAHLVAACKSSLLFIERRLEGVVFCEGLEWDKELCCDTVAP